MLQIKEIPGVEYFTLASTEPKPKRVDVVVIAHGQQQYIMAFEEKCPKYRSEITSQKIKEIMEMLSAARDKVQNQSAEAPKPVAPALVGEDPAASH